MMIIAQKIKVEKGECIDVQKMIFINMIIIVVASSHV